MGHGAWTSRDFETYAVRNGRTVKKDGTIAGNYTAQEMYTSRRLSPALDPRGVIRECCDSEDHPKTIPVILALDVTGSMGGTAVEIARKLNVIMTDLYKKVDDVEFLVMGIGDFMYDAAPLQVSQFESDIRIAEQLDQIYFEGGGGGNSYESYSAAWYFGARHTRLDCWKRGRKGIIITMGDEPCNPHIPIQGRRVNFGTYMGDNLQADVETRDILPEVQDKYELFHLFVDHATWSHNRMQSTVESFTDYLGNEHVKVVTPDTITQTLVDIIVDYARRSAEEAPAWTTPTAETTHVAAWGAPVGETTPTATWGTPANASADGTHGTGVENKPQTKGNSKPQPKESQHPRGGFFGGILSKVSW